MKKEYISPSIEQLKVVYESLLDAPSQSQTDDVLTGEASSGGTPGGGGSTEHDSGSGEVGGIRGNNGQWYDWDD